MQEVSENHRQPGREIAVRHVQPYPINPAVGLSERLNRLDALDLTKGQRVVVKVAREYLSSGRADLAQEAIAAVEHHTNRIKS